MAYDMTDFEADVLDASASLPVLVDFWAPWCGPCRMLSPVLERLAEEQKGRWRLVKINSDDHPELAARFGVRGIPSVKLIIDGEVADEFTGALPEHVIRQWLDKAIPTESAKMLAAARNAIEEGRNREAETALRSVLHGEPESDEAKILLASVLLFDDPEEARALLKGSEPVDARSIKTKEAVQVVSEAMNMQGDDLPEGPGREAFSASLDALRRRDFAEAISRLIDVLQRDRYFGGDEARRVGIALFTLLGPRHPVTTSKRRLFDMYLY